MRECREVYYDTDLHIEAYRLSGCVQKFPNHFHTYYVIGFIKSGKRQLCCKHDVYDLSAGDLILFNPKDTHFCSPINGEPLDYRAINLQPTVMQSYVQEITGRSFLPHMNQTILYKSDIALSVGDLYDAVVHAAPRFEKEETLFFLLAYLLKECTAPFECRPDQKKSTAIEYILTYLEENYTKNITLDTLTDITHLSKSHLLYLFTKEVGVSPYRYLQSLRIERAKKLLEEGETPAATALKTGFSDQSHFSRFFKTFIGLTPKQYQKIF